MPDNEYKRYEQNNDRLDFILQTEIPKQKTFLQKIKSKAGIFFIGICAVVIAVIISIPFLLNSRANEAQKNKLISIAQTQTEIIRIADLGESRATTEDARAKAASIKITISDSLNDIELMLVERNVNINEASFSGKKNGETDSQLIESLQNNSFETKFNEIIDQNLFEYQRLLLEAQDSARENEKPGLDNAYEKSNELLGLRDES